MQHSFLQRSVHVNTSVSPTDLKIKDEILGPLASLKASNLIAGPFGVALTDKPAKHLTFSESHSLDLNVSLDFTSPNVQALQGFILQGFALMVRDAGMPSLFRELMCSHILLTEDPKRSANNWVSMCPGVPGSRVSRQLLLPRAIRPRFSHIRNKTAIYPEKDE